MKDFLIIFVGIYLSLSVSGFVVGVCDAQYPSRPHGCYSPITRIGKFFPAYRFGCYMGEVPGRSK